MEFFQSAVEETAFPVSVPVAVQAALFPQQKYQLNLIPGIIISNISWRSFTQHKLKQHLNNQLNQLNSQPQFPEQHLPGLLP